MIMENESLKAQADNIIKQLTAVKEEFVRNKEEIAVSIRKDIVSIELKSILVENTDYYSLRNALETYIENLCIKGE